MEVRNITAEKEIMSKIYKSPLPMFLVPVCPHAGGVGLCEMVQHLQIWDYISLSGEAENRMIEWVDHLHEHFTDPPTVRNGRYIAPEVFNFR